MKNILILSTIAAAFSLTACQAGTAQKVRNALDKVECVADVLSPYVQYFTSDQFEGVLAGGDYLEILDAAGVTPTEVKGVVAAIKACKEEK